MSELWIEALSTRSSMREKILEHRFLAEVASELWRRGRFDLAISRGEVDDSGYDVVLELGQVARHIQLKAKYTGGKAARYAVQMALTEKPSGCVVVMAHKLQNLEFDHFYFLGSQPGLPLSSLGEKVSRHTKGDSLGYKAERPRLRDVALGAFRRIDTTSELVEALFGAAAEPAWSAS